MEIKTIFNPDHKVFDAEVNAALADGFQLVKRMSDQPDAFIAELVKPDPEPEIVDPWAAVRDIISYCGTVPVEGCGTDRCALSNWCEKLREGGDPTEWQVPET